MPFWGALINGLWIAAFTWIIPLITKVAVSLGIGFVTYSGVDMILTTGETYVYSNFQGLPANALALATIAGFDQGIKMVFSGWSAAIGIKTAMGAMDKWRARPSVLRA